MGRWEECEDGGGWGLGLESRVGVRRRGFEFGGWIWGFGRGNGSLR